MLFFCFEIIQMLVEETCYCQHLDTVDEGHYALPEVTVQDMCVCFWQLLCSWGVIWWTHWRITGGY